MDNLENAIVAIPTGLNGINAAATGGGIAVGIMLLLFLIALFRLRDRVRGSFLHRSKHPKVFATNIFPKEGEYCSDWIPEGVNDTI